jgi:hypothetical protein
MEISNEEKQCNWCGEVKLITEYHKNRFGADGYSPRCATCTGVVAKVVSKTGVNLPDEYITDANKDDIEGAKILLTRIGFDLKQDIYEQFKQRIIEKHNVDIDNIPKRNKTEYNGNTRSIEYQKWYNTYKRKK